MRRMNCSRFPCPRCSGRRTSGSTNRLLRRAAVSLSKSANICVSLSVRVRTCSFAEEQSCIPMRTYDGGNSYWLTGVSKTVCPPACPRLDNRPQQQKHKRSSPTGLRRCAMWTQLYSAVHTKKRAAIWYSDANMRPSAKQQPTKGFVCLRENDIEISLIERRPDPPPTHTHT